MNFAKFYWLIEVVYIYIIKIEGVLGQILERDAKIYSSKTRFISIYRYILIMIREIGFKPNI